jgi:hypothetical protein
VKYGINDNSYRPPEMSGTPGARTARRARLTALYGQPGTDNTFWKEISAANYINQQSGKIGLFHAVNDDVVDVGYSRDLSAFLEKKNISHIKSA